MARGNTPHFFSVPLSFNQHNKYSLAKEGLKGGKSTHLIVMSTKMLCIKKFKNAMHTDEETIKMKTKTSNDIANSAIPHLYKAVEESNCSRTIKFSNSPSICKRVKQKTYPDWAVFIRFGT